MTKATIHYHDIGDYLDQKEKLAIIAKFKSMANPAMPFTVLAPNEHGDWLAQRNEGFGAFVALGDKDDKTNQNTFFVPLYSNGLKTQRDAWCYNSSKKRLKENILKSINFYNDQLHIIKESGALGDSIKINKIMSYDAQKISWTRALVWDLEKGKVLSFDENAVRNSYYRPFFKQHLYFSKALNEMPYQIPKLFPTLTTKNRVICVSGVGVNKEFSCIITDTLPDLELIGKSQCFPLYYYEERAKQTPSLFDQDAGGNEYVQRDGISDFILGRARELYGPNVSKEDLFYYVYGFLHEPAYRETFANDLKKMLPRLPLVGSVPDFWAFSKTGRKLAELHIGYEQVPPHPDVKVTGREYGNFVVDKMKFLAKDKKYCIIYNNHIQLDNIPDAAYEYIVNGKSAIEWIVERYQITTHKESGIVNNPNDWAKEVGNESYILDLLLSVIHVSTQTVELVKGLPKVDWEVL